MNLELALFAGVVLVTFVFGLTNGFLDGGGMVSTVVSTRVVEPLRAIVLVALCELLGLLLLGRAVAFTVSRQLFHLPASTHAEPVLVLVLAALTGALLWNLLMWRLSFPSSSSHALMGGLAGAAWALFGSGSLQAVTFAQVLLLLAIVPTLGLIVSFFLTKGLFLLGAYVTPLAKGPLHRLQIFSLAAMAMAHGSNDGQKTLGLLLLAYGAWSGTPDPMPGWFYAISGGALAIGIVAGSQRTLHTLGRRFYRIQEAQAFSASTATMALLGASSLVGIPMSSAHLLTASIIGSGVAVRARGVRWMLVGEMALSWLVTIPCAGLVAAGMAKGLQRGLHVVP